ncbi:Calmodulin-binding receptor-like cytoplasmic kinase [Sesamum alatum]|uniref:non-specific serine/threonine protein kinase n=1 Tax=Sesamum alatum TaxID=300844 RepID=A0AAE2C7Z0_9LAMI|nr:Calmodulin-binding receptor-like cytoplasmic kinase [Sesamum alatum]
MKKTQSPLIIRPGHIRKLNSNSSARTAENYTGKNHQKSNNNHALNYIISATKKAVDIFAAIFLQQKKVDSNTIPYQAGQTSYSLNTSPARGSRKSLISRLSTYDGSPEVDTAQSQNTLSFEEIHKATGKFSPANKIGEGGFGTVYKGILKNRTVVAVKRAKREPYDQRLSAEFKNEILALSKIEHLNLVRFYGYLQHRDERLIVIEYVSNGTLREHLDGNRGSWLEIGARLDIAIDVAHAITYLHTYTDPPIIHRDIKASNILITEKLRAKVANFGFARLAAEDPGATHISTQIKGTAGYLDPEYLRTYQLTDKSDVYSFGVLLVEMVTGRHPIESKRSAAERVTIKWALGKLKDGGVAVAVDPRLRRGVASIQAVESVLKLARHCLSPSRLSRPSMRRCAEILWEIRKEYRENSTISASFHYANVVEGYGSTSRQNVFGIETVIA